jgi:hypothetical protein
MLKAITSADGVLSLRLIAASKAQRSARLMMGVAPGAVTVLVLLSTVKDVRTSRTCLTHNRMRMKISQIGPGILSNLSQRKT